MKASYFIVILVLIAAGAGAIFLNGGFTQSIAGTNVFNGCTWQEDYWWVTCQSIPESPITLTGNYVCPSGADIDYCKIVSASYGYNYPLAECASCGTFLCADCHDIQVGSTVAQGRTIRWTGSTVVQVYKKQLRSCGLAACSSGSGEPITGAQGCSWKPQAGSNIPLPLGIDLTKVDPIDTVAEGQSYKYVYSQHLVSCPQQCEPGKDDLSCTVSTAGKYGQTVYGGQAFNYYTAGREVRIVGCKSGTKTNQCILYNDDYSQCLKYGDIQNGQCGTIAVLDAGQCSQNSDCGDTTRYACNWDSQTLKGTCVPIGQQNTQECSSDYQCTQTAPTCNAKQYGSQKCVSGKCQVVSTPVQCCTSTDCANNYFCNSQFKCEESQQQKPECPTGQCCEGSESYRERTCSDMTGGQETVCCADGSCSATKDGCNSHGGSTSQRGLLEQWIIPALLGLIGGFLAYLKLEGKEKTTRIIGAMIAGVSIAVIAKILLDFIFGIAWWQWLIVGVLGGIGLWLFGGVILMIIIIIISKEVI